MDKCVEINIKRLYYLLKLYNISEDDLLSMLNDGKKTILKKEQVFTNNISLPLLKRIDKIFNKGLNYYIDFSPISEKSHTSIFFRKKDFNGELNLEARKIVDHFESLKKGLDAYSLLADVNFERKLAFYSVLDSAKDVAENVRKLLEIRNHKDEKSHLKFIINRLSEKNIYVFEYIEPANKKHKSNIEGFFISPNVIVIKRQQGYLKRELFTLAHELGHCLLNSEEVENVTDEFTQGLSEIEKWCNDFAFYFLMGEDITTLNDLQFADATNDYAAEPVKKLSEKTHVSMLAIYTRLVIEKKMTRDDYNLVRGGILNSVKTADSGRKKQLNGDMIHIQSPRPIISNLFRDTLQCALYKGVINEAVFCQQLNVKPERIFAYL